MKNLLVMMTEKRRRTKIRQFASQQNHQFHREHSSKEVFLSHEMTNCWNSPKDVNKRLSKPDEFLSALKNHINQGPLKSKKPPVAPPLHDEDIFYQGTIDDLQKFVSMKILFSSLNRSRFFLDFSPISTKLVSMLFQPKFIRNRIVIM